MTRNEILAFINKNPVFYLATSEDNTPHVRAIMLYKADENGIFFNTGKNKDLHKQLTVNQSVEMCFYSPEENRQVRISGSVALMDDLELKKEVVEKFPFLKPWIEKEGYDVLAPYCLKKGKATVWTMETAFAPKEYIDF